MSIIDDLKSRADANGDGKITKEDLEKIKQDNPEHDQHIEELKKKIDANRDGKLDISDAQSMLSNLGGLGDKLKNFGK